MTAITEYVSTSIALVTFSSAVVNYVIIRPLRDSITALQQTIEKLDARLTELDNKMDENKERLVLAEASTKQAHKRLDEVVRAKCEC